MMKKIYYVIEFENRLDDYCIGDFNSYTEAEKYIKDNNLDEYPRVPIIVKKYSKTN